MLKEPFEEPERKGDEKLPPPELKPLPKELKYRFLDDTNKYPVIISSKPTGEEEEQLMAVLKKFRKAFGYPRDDLKGIIPSIGTHRIFMEERAQPVSEFNRRMKPDMKEVVRKEIILLLDVGIIYSVKESDWVSHVHCVPTKGQFTVVANEHNELVPTRTIVGHRMCINYRILNKETRKDRYPLTFINKTLERLAKHSHFCYLDGYFGFSQIIVHTEDQLKTIFVHSVCTLIVRCPLVYAMHLLLSKDVRLPYFLILQRRIWKFSWTISLSMELNLNFASKS
jgi:hypothetical protein